VSKSDVKKTFELKKAIIAKELNSRIEEYENLIVKLGLRADVYDVHELVNYLEKSTKAGNEGINFIEFARGEVDKMKSDGRSNPAKNYELAIKNLEKFMAQQKIDTLYVSDISVKFLQDYERFVSGFGVRAPSLYIAAIRHLFYRARDEYNDEDEGVILIPNNPFKKYKVPKQNIAEKRGLTSDIIRQITDCNPKTERAKFAKDMFLLSFYLVGINAIDLYYCKPPVNGYLIYQRAKTKDRRSDRAEIHIKLEPEAMELYEKYKDETGERAFCFYKHFSDNHVFNRSINTGLKTIGNEIGVPKLTFRIRRLGRCICNYNHIDNNNL
jgi:hypothetical protein